jgi:hypothetical protein
MARVSKAYTRPATLGPANTTICTARSVVSTTWWRAKLFVSFECDDGVDQDADTRRLLSGASERAERISL